MQCFQAAAPLAPQGRERQSEPLEEVKGVNTLEGEPRCKVEIAMYCTALYRTTTPGTQLRLYAGLLKLTPYATKTKMVA